MMANRNILTFVVCTALMVVPVVLTKRLDCSHVKCGPERAYGDLRCKPQIGLIFGENCCPKWWDCDHLFNRSSKLCYVNRNVYQLNEMIKPEDLNVCDEGCFCRMHDDGVARVRCDEITCNEPRKDSNYYRQYSPSDCCGGTMMPKDYRTKCVVDGHTYYSGDSFQLENEPEIDCVCQISYLEKVMKPNDTIPEEKPACVPRKRYLSIPEGIYTLLGSQKCAPVYDFTDNVEIKTLPHVVRCKDENDYVIRTNKTGVAGSGRRQCVYDNFRLNVGDKIGSIGTGMDRYECVCEVPPFLTCRTDKKRSGKARNSN